jgi:hypothetical protein
MAKIYSNLPSSRPVDSANNTIKYFDQYYINPLQLDNNATLATTAFFEKRGFSPEAAQTIALVIVSQAKNDNLNYSEIIDTLTEFDDVRLSRVVGDILNYNRFKSSALAIYVTPTAADEVQRNILA